MEFTGYVARDKMFNQLYLHLTEPIRRNGVYVSARGCIELDKDAVEFAHLTHTDKPIRVTINLSRDP